MRRTIAAPPITPNLIEGKNVSDFVSTMGMAILKDH